LAYFSYKSSFFISYGSRAACDVTSQYSDIEVLTSSDSDDYDDLDISSSSDDSDDCDSEMIELDYKLFPVSLEKADPMCIRLNTLIRDGVITQDKILYKLLDNITSNLLDVNHEWDKDVLEFYNTLKYLGGERVVNFIRGPMYLGTGRGGTKTSDKANFNIGGPSKPTLQKNTSSYTVHYGVIKPWLISFMAFAEEKAAPLLSSGTYKVVGAALENDGTALASSLTRIST